eukprot:6456999-Amphidinium_carterae.1
MRRVTNVTADEVGTLRNNYWVSHGTRLFLVSPEQMRSATVEERMAQGVYEDARARLQEMLQGEERIPFTDERWPEEGIELEALGVPAVGTQPSQVSTPRRSELEPDAEPLRANAGADEGTGSQPMADAVGPEAVEEEVLVLELKPGGKELNPRLFNEEERKLFDAADMDQLNAHLKTGAFEVIPPEEADKIRSGPERRFVLPVPTRLLRVNKGDQVQVKAKSRLILPGHVCGVEDGVRTDSPTAPQVSLYFLLSMAVQRDWKVTSFDVSNAFLSGQHTTRLLYVQPPKDSAHLGLSNRHLLKVMKGVFGLPESPRLWWLEIRRMLLESGWIEHHELVATFLLFEESADDKSKQLVGLLSLHVDDGIWAGNGACFEKAQESLREMVTSRTTLKEEKGSVLQLLGRRIEMGPDWISVDCEKYVEGISHIEVSRSRRNEKQSSLTDAEHSALLSLVQQLAWPARVCMPQISYLVSKLQQSASKACVETLLEANAALRKAKTLASRRLYFRKLNVPPGGGLKLVVMHDASFAGEQGLN